jgi:hemin uptake protein HemP
VNSHNPFHFSQGSVRPASATDNRIAMTRQPAKIVASQSLFQGEHEIGIDHQGSLYRLKITRQGKLILNK